MNDISPETAQKCGFPGFFFVYFIVICVIVLGIIFYLQMTKTNVLHISREDVIRIYIVDGNTGNITDIEENYFDEIYER